ncbi:beta-1,6-N-acetylglucosaminyltransferase [Elizabethkingia meningoseptica]
MERLIHAIDDSRNDIYIHFDKKVKVIPDIKTTYSDLYILENRIDVRWGDVSVVNAEYLLFEEAVKNGEYNYYHLLSGVDMPLKSQDDIYIFFNKHQGKEFIGFYQYPMEEEMDRKVNRVHLFPRNFRSNRGILPFIKKLLRFSMLKLQYILKYRRNRTVAFKKGTQWVSLTDNFVKYTLKKKNEVLRIYKNTFCSDEIFLQTICWNSPFKEEVFDLRNEGRGCMRMIGWKNGVLYDWEDKDYEDLVQSEYLFARKFNSKNIQLVDRLLNHINSKKETESENKI